MQKINGRTHMIKKISVKKKDMLKILKNPLLICGTFTKIDSGRFFFHGIKQRRVKKGGKYE